MDRSSGLSKKCCYRATSDEDKADRISNPPENILSHILSLLPTKDAVRTSVLSTEWVYRWTSIYNISFDDNLCNFEACNNKAKRGRFMSFVERVLLLCRNTVFEELQLFCRWNYDHSRVKTSMSAMLRCTVKKVDIRYDGPLNFPKIFFSCDSVIELKLRVRDVRLPDDSLHSNLKILAPSSVCIQSLGLQSTRNLFTFPVLEKLHFQKCQ
ncbi:F-box/LRR-repeat protein At4g14103-like [Coffea arabica]|uniref:F-box/LRR-repeat protein At4g14103-like n=1 Tax=Coffea arabica TaxID=13443 RepID=A0A6P6S3Q6_COFAR|nr:F-box/LRR-repeat protein At4g14103-like [Coffea arabica]